MLHYWGFQQHLMPNSFQDSGFFWKNLKSYIFICTHRDIFKISLSVFTTHRTADVCNFSSFKEGAKEKPQKRIKIDLMRMAATAALWETPKGHQKNVSWQGCIQWDVWTVIFQIATARHTNFSFFLSKYPSSSSAVLPGTWTAEIQNTAGQDNPSTLSSIQMSEPNSESKLLKPLKSSNKKNPNQTITNFIS